MKYALITCPCCSMEQSVYDDEAGPYCMFCTKALEVFETDFIHDADEDYEFETVGPKLTLIKGGKV